MAQSLNPKAAPAAKKLMMALMGGAGLVLLGGGGVLVGLNSHLSGLQTTARQKQQEVDGSEGIAKHYLSTQDAYTQTQSRMQCLEASVSPKSYVPTLLGQLQALAATTHLDVQAVRPAAPAPPVPPAPSHSAAGGDAAVASADTKKAPPPPPYDTMEIDVDTTGTYADTATFLYSLTRFPKIISVTGVQMHPSASTDKANPHAAPAVTTNLKLIAFMFHDDGAAAPAVPGAALAQAVPSAGTSPTTQAAALPSAVMPPTAVGTISGAAGRAAAGAVGATKAANARGSVGVGTL
jgi:hypothetical protein